MSSQYRFSTYEGSLNLPPKETFSCNDTRNETGGKFLSKRGKYRSSALSNIQVRKYKKFVGHHTADIESEVNPSFLPDQGAHARNVRLHILCRQYTNFLLGLLVVAEYRLSYSVE